jgi:hypothetical protein
VVMRVVARTATVVRSSTVDGLGARAVDAGVIAVGMVVGVAARMRREMGGRVGEHE